VEVGQGTPFFIIGNSGYGKPLLHRSLNYNSTLHEALKAGQLSFDSTYVSANDVDYPIDVAVYVKDSFNIIQHRFERDDLIGVSKKWNELLKESMNKLPSDWMDVVFTKLNEKAFK
jgi:putative proteasome-type protease